MSRRLFASIIAVLCFCMSFIWLANFSDPQTEPANAAIFSENDLQNKVDYLPVDESVLAGKYSNILSAAPFDSRIEGFMEGKSLTPIADEYKQFDFIFNFDNTQSIETIDSFYAWVYLPGDPLTNFYDLQFTLYLGGGSVTWLFDFNVLSDMSMVYSGGTVSYGWKLFELCPADNTSSTIDTSKISNYQVTGLGVSYKVNKELLDQSGATVPPYYPKTNMSIYHIYKAVSHNGYSGMILSLNYSSFKTKESFRNSFNGLYVGDKYKFGQASDIFEYVYVGKDEISNKSLTGWKIEVENNGKVTNYEFGGTLEIKNTGSYSLSIKYQEFRSSSSITIVNYSDSFYVEEFGIGSFTMPDYSFKVGETFMATFEINAGFILDGEVKVTSSDESIASVEYVKNGKVVSVQVTGHKKGKVNIVVEAQGHREGEAVKTYSSKSLVRVTSTETSNLSQLILWISLGIFSVVLLGYLIISFVQARKNSVK